MIAPTIIVRPEGRLFFHGRTLRCALGRGGIAMAKTEGDGATPVGTFALRWVYFRADRQPTPRTGLAITAITPDMGWCDDPGHGRYNRPVRRPFAGRHERLWRVDALYDLVVVIGHNDTPPRPGDGSAVFLHVASPAYGPTAGCVALNRRDLVWLLSRIGPETAITIEPD